MHVVGVRQEGELRIGLVRGHDALDTLCLKRLRSNQSDPIGVRVRSGSVEADNANHKPHLWASGGHEKLFALNGP